MAFTTYGQLRQELAAQGIKWSVNPAFADDATIKRYATGADLTNYPQAKDAAPVDVAALVKDNPTTNTLLRKELVTRGLLPPLAVSIGSSSQLPAAATKDLTSGLKTVSGASGAEGELPSVSGGSNGSLPASVDWTNRWTWNFVTGIRDQDPCEHCWIYSSTALVETQVRIEHCVWCDRSEGDYIEANKVVCGQCGSPGPVLSWAQNSGWCDQSCVAWVDNDNSSGPGSGPRTSSYWNPPPSSCGTGSNAAPPAYNPPSNRDGKTVRLPAYTTLGDVNDQKNWIASVGPLVAAFEVYSDFYGWSGNVPYTKSANAQPEGGHVICVVGYNDTLGCWIIKNSWGPGWGNSGFGLIGYGQCGIDTNSKLGIQLTNPDPWTKRREHSGGMIESGDGALHRNFELLAPSKGKSFTHWWRNNAVSNLPWAAAETEANDVAIDLTLTGTTYNRNFETIYLTTGNRLHHWYFDQSTGKWVNGPIFGPTNAEGCVGFCESDYTQGQFDVVVAVRGGSFEHWSRVSGNWSKVASFGSGFLTAGPSLLETTFGNLEFVGTCLDGTLQHFYRSGGNWIAAEVFASGVKSHACMIQGQFGIDTDSGNGNFELCVAMPNGAVQHWWRNNQASSYPWAMGAQFGSNVNRVIALLQGSFGFNLELIVLRNDGLLQHYWRDDGGWHADAGTIGTTL